MNILILEDTNTFVEEFVDILKNNNLFADAHFFCLGDHFEEIDNTKDYQIIFIDVHLSKSINGIDFSIKLKKRFPKHLLFLWPWTITLFINPWNFNHFISLEKII